MSTRQKVVNTIKTVFIAHFFCTRPPYSTARAGMDMSPTSVAAVICQALSPEPSQVGYGITVFTPPGACFHATVNVSHAGVSRAFPVCYAAGNVPGENGRDVS